jgi:hypothetical protein
MSRSFYLIRGVVKGGGEAEGQIVFENQIGTAVTRMMTRRDIDHLEIWCSDEHAWMQQQKRKAQEQERRRDGGARV